ncbi:alanine--tRNA ligase, partial [Campylobacter upsaliensis]
PLINQIASLCGRAYVYESGASYRVIADHIRSSAFLLAQGVSFDKEGRGYVLRRILRRALRHGYLLGLKEPFMYKLVDVLCELMGGHYAYLNEKKEAIKEQIKLEEERFLSTIEKGIELFNEELAKTQNIFSGEIAFKLYDTYGFPLDLTQDMLREKGLSIDEECFERLMSEQKERAKAAWKGSGDKAVSGDFKILLERFGKNEFVGYTQKACESQILALLDENFKMQEKLHKGQTGWVFLDKTPFYANSGGQVGDKGFLGENEISDTQKFFELNLSKITAKNELKLDEKLLAHIDEGKREQIARHHSATHLLHYALRKILGAHIAQAGSLVEFNKLRFDFNHPKALTKEELEKIENLVNEMISSSYPALLEEMSLDDAKQSGAIALFSEKYENKVRVLSLGESKELCGGTHVNNSAEIGSFFILKESGVSAGVRRIEAVVSKAAHAYAKNALKELESLKIELKNNDLLSGISKLKNEISKLKNELKNSNSSELKSENVKGVQICIAKVENGDIKAMIDHFKNQFEKAVILLIQEKEGKISLAAGVKNAPLKAGNLVKNIAMILGGNGGGKDDFATAGGKDLTKIDEALKEAKSFIEKGI